MAFLGIFIILSAYLSSLKLKFMIIFYGSKSSHVKSAYLDDAVCPSCETSGQMVMSVFAFYAHVFWIPLFPLYKKVYANCNHCQAAYELKEMPQDLRDQCVKFRRGQRFPIWHFAGLIAICLIILFGVFSDSNASRRQNAYLTNPQVNDVYVIQYDNEDYSTDEVFSTMKIVEITSDSIYFADNNFYAEKGANVSTIDEDDNYNYEELMSSTIEELKGLKEKGFIYYIIRGK